MRLVHLSPSPVPPSLLLIRLAQLYHLATFLSTIQAYSSQLSGNQGGPGVLSAAKRRIEGRLAAQSPLRYGLRPTLRQAQGVAQDAIGLCTVLPLLQFSKVQETGQRQVISWGHGAVPPSTGLRPELRPRAQELLLGDTWKELSCLDNESKFKLSSSLPQIRKCDIIDITSNHNL